MTGPSWAEDRPGGAFGGVFRAWIWPAILVGLCPILAILFWMIAVEFDGSVTALLDSDLGTVAGLWPWPTWAAVGVLASWGGLQLVLLVVLPGAEHLGPPTPAGERPKYRANGVLTWLVTHVLWFVAAYGLGLFSPTIVYDHFGPILMTSSFFALVFCALLVVVGSRLPPSQDVSRTGNPIWDFWNGVELHPVWAGVQLKQLFNCRFAMMGWSLILLSFAAAQIERDGSLAPAMAASVGLQVVYILKFFRWETGYFASLDITHDRFGFYLCWGVMVWLPSLYTLHSLFLVENNDFVGWPGALAIIALGLGALGANYAADAQRQRVRATGGDTTVWGRPPEMIEAEYTTEDGTRRTSLLLVSGWWGTSRHFNYVAELTLAFAWCAPGGFRHLLPWSYLIFLTILLVDRARRDERRCAAKYGPAWDEYCQRVRWRMIPGIY